MKGGSCLSSPMSTIRAWKEAEIFLPNSIFQAGDSLTSAIEIFLSLDSFSATNNKKQQWIHSIKSTVPGGIVEWNEILQYIEIPYQYR